LKKFIIHAKPQPAYNYCVSLKLLFIYSFTLRDYESKSKPRLTPLELLKQHGISAEYMAFGVERIDYTKGLVEKFLLVERFLDKYPQ